MDWKAHDRKRKEQDQQYKSFEEAPVVAQDVFVDSETEDNDETKTVAREVEGQLAVDVRKRVNAPADAPVVVVEVDQQVWLSDITADNDYRTTVKCNGVERTFNTYSARENFRKLLEWLDESPDTPVGGKED